MSTTDQSISAENLLQCALNRLARSTSVTTSMFWLAIIAIPIGTAGHALSAHAHNWPGRDRQLGLDKLC